VAATVKLVPSIFVIAQVTPVAEPRLLISSAVRVAGLIASENVSVKFTGVEFVDAAPDLANDVTLGATLSWV
jgi:hypothetical protein